jgi:hypothetical protein
MSTLKNEKDFEKIKNNSLSEPYVWDVKADVKIAIHAYKAYINNGSTEEQFDARVKKMLHEHFKTDHAIDSTEEVLITQDDLQNLGMTLGELKICVDTIAKVLAPEVQVKRMRPNEDSQGYEFKIILSLIK